MAVEGGKGSIAGLKWESEWQRKDRKVEIADGETGASYVEELRDLLNESSLAERKTFIKSFVKEIAVMGDEMVLTYNTPYGQLKEEKLEHERCLLHGGLRELNPPFNIFCDKIQDPR